MPVYGTGALLSSLIWFGFAAAAALKGKFVFAVLFTLVGLLVIAATLRLRRQFRRRMDGRSRAQ
jgi:hypothetical protein